MQAIDKARVLEALRARIRTKRDTVVSSQRATQSGATHAETRQEHPKDTRAIEAGYLARGLAERAESLSTGIALLENLDLEAFPPGAPVALSALVGFENDAGEQHTAFLVPFAGGEVVQVEDTSVQCLTPVSPLGRALLGRHVDDEFEIALPAGAQTLIVRWIR